ncbi:MAG: hypothetical protein ACI87E_002926, partial [Mariniblastus sp.]
RPGYPEFCPAFEDRMNSQASKSSLRFGTRGLLIATVVVAVLISTILYVRKPIRDARKIRLGDSAQRVHQLLGPPGTAFESDAELRQSDLVPMSFVFTDTTNTMSDVLASQLPMVNYRAEWFPMGSTAGHLVYYNKDGVEIVFWGGT